MDFTKASGATFRKVGNGHRDGNPSHIVHATRIYPTTPEDLWSALTEQKRLARWFSEVTGDLSLNGRFSIKGNADGDITHCEPPHSLALTWEFGASKSWVKITIEKDDGGALLTLEHEHPTDPESEKHWDQYGPGATGVGWEWAMIGLDAHIANPDESLLAAGGAWAESPEGKATLRTWAMAWGDAHAKSGTPAKTATDTAKRTAAFYTGES